MAYSVKIINIDDRVIIQHKSSKVFGIYVVLSEEPSIVWKMNFREITKQPEYKNHKFHMMIGNEIRVTVTPDDDIQEKVDLLKNIVEETNTRTEEGLKPIKMTQEKETQKEFERLQNEQLIKDKIKNIKL